MIQKGSKVQIHYTLTVDGEKVDSSQGGEPLSYVHGEGHIIPGLEQELTGLALGDQKSIQVTPEMGYGEHDPEAIEEVPKSAFPDPDQLAVGGVVSGQTGDGQAFHAQVAEVGAEYITLDMNHPLAGKTLDFQIEVVEIS